MPRARSRPGPRQRPQPFHRSETRHPLRDRTRGCGPLHPLQADFPKLPHLAKVVRVTRVTLLPHAWTGVKPPSLPHPEHRENDTGSGRLRRPLPPHATARKTQRGRRARRPRGEARAPRVAVPAALALRQTRALAPRSSQQTQVSSWRTGRAAATVRPQRLGGAGLRGTHAGRHRKVGDHLRHASVPSPTGLTSNVPSTAPAHPRGLCQRAPREEALGSAQETQTTSFFSRSRCTPPVSRGSEQSAPAPVPARGRSVRERTGPHVKGFRLRHATGPTLVWRQGLQSEVLSGHSTSAKRAGTVALRTGQCSGKALPVHAPCGVGGTVLPETASEQRPHAGPEPPPGHLRQHTPEWDTLGHRTQWVAGESLWQQGLSPRRNQGTRPRLNLPANTSMPWKGRWEGTAPQTPPNVSEFVPETHLRVLQTSQGCM